MSNNQTSAKQTAGGVLRRFVQTVFLSSNSILWFSFFLPLLLLLFICVKNGIAPFGDASLLFSGTGNAQTEIYRSLHDALFENGPLLSPLLTGTQDVVSWFSVIVSPFTYLVVLFPADKLAAGLLLAYLLQCGFAGLTFGIYLRFRHRATPAVTLIGSLLYALSSFTLLAGHLPSLAMTVILFPLVVLGAYRLIRERHFALFTLALAAAIITNPEMLLLSLAVAVLLFFYFSITEEREARNPQGEESHFANSLLRYLIMMTVALGLSLCVVIPFGFVHFGAAAKTAEFQMDFSLVELLTKCLPSSYDTITHGSTPYLYCGVLSLIAVPLFMLRRDVSARRRIVVFAVLVLTAFFMLVQPINLFLDGFTIPSYLDFRYAFLLVFLLVSLAAETLDKQDAFSAGPVFSVAGLAGLLLIILQKLNLQVPGTTKDVLPDLAGVWLAIGALIVYAFLLIATHEKPKYKTVLHAGIAVFVALEMCVSGVTVLGEVKQDARYLAVDELLPALSEESEAGYRLVTAGDSELEGSADFAGTPRMNAEFADYFGVYTTTRYTGNALLDGLFGVRYVLTDAADPGAGFERITPLPEETPDDEEDNGKEADEREPAVWYLKTNENALPPAFVTQTVTQTPEGSDPFTRTNLLLSALSGVARDVYLPVSADADIPASLFTVHTEKEGHVLLSFTHTENAAAKITVGSKTVASGDLSGVVVDLGYRAGNSTFTVRITVSDGTYSPESVRFCTMDQSTVEQTLDALREGGMTEMKIGEHAVSGTMTGLPGGSTVVTTLPAEGNVRVNVDGGRAETYSLGGLLCFTLPEGTHNVTLRYRSVSGIVARVLSGVFLLVFAAAIFLTFRMRAGKLRAGDFFVHVLPVPDNAEQAPAGNGAAAGDEEGRDE